MGLGWQVNEVALVSAEDVPFLCIVECKGKGHKPDCGQERHLVEDDKHDFLIA